MDKIILRHRKTGETRTVDRAKYEALAPERKALYEIAAEPTTEQLAEARRLAGIGDGPSTAESFGRGVLFGRGFDAPTNIGGAVAEAAGSGLRDAVLAGIAARLGSPRLAAAVPTISGAIEGALDPTLEGTGERLTGAAIGGLLANVPMPKILERTVGKVGGAAGELIGKIRAGSAKQTAAEAKKVAAEAAKEIPAGITPGTIERLAPQTSSVKRTQSMIEGAEPSDAEAEIIEEMAGKIGKAETTQQIAKEARKGARAAEEAVEPTATAGMISATAGAQGAAADIVRQAPQQAIAAIMADPRLEGKQLSDVTPSEMWAALKRAVTLIGDEEQRINELAIQESKR